MSSQQKIGVVRNKAPAEIQITGEQILREIYDKKRAKTVSKAPVQLITDQEELDTYREAERRKFESQIRQQRQYIGPYLKYAKWEEDQREFTLARSVYERALEVSREQEIDVWLRYAEMEMRHQFVNFARNVFDRAVTMLPREDKLWYKYVEMEETVGDLPKTRAIFERWMAWDPDDNAWYAFIKFEKRCRNISGVRDVYERYLYAHNSLRAYLNYASFEEKFIHDLAASRAIYERAEQELSDSEKTEELYIQFAQFEERCKEYERARVIYKYAIEMLNQNSHGNSGKMLLNGQNVKLEQTSSMKSATSTFQLVSHTGGESKSSTESETLSTIATKTLYNKYLAFEKRHGSHQGIEDAVITKSRSKYKDILTNNSLDYNTWFDYIRLEEAEGNLLQIRDVYEKAISNIPPIQDKRYWRRYIYIWINYALFEELQAEDFDRTREVYKTCLGVIPHKKFSFSKIWILFAKFEIRRKNLDKARKILGQAIGLCGKEKIFKTYLAIEHSLGEFDRCRTIFAKYIEAMPFNYNAWINFAKLEKSCHEIERCRAIYESGISEEEMERPETLWKSYIDFEVAEGNYNEARSLFNRLLEKTTHWRVWVTFAEFEASIPAISNDDVLENARTVFDRGYEKLKLQGLKEERLKLLEARIQFEENKGSVETVDQVRKLLPRKLKKRRMTMNEETGEEEPEEYYDYQFPDDPKPKGSTFKILEMAKNWKSSQETSRKI